jgi:hypothetical protein
MGTFSSSCHESEVAARHADRCRVPPTEIGPDAGAVRAYGTAGFRHVLAYDHVLGADPAVYQCWNGPYDIASTFHEPLVLSGYLAAHLGHRSQAQVQSPAETAA